MSTFSEQWVACMHSNGMPVPVMEDAREALEFMDKIHQAIENSGGDLEVTIGTLIAVGALVGVDEAALAVLGEAAEVAAAVYISFCVACLSSVAIDTLREIFALNELPDYVVADLNNQGVDLAQDAVA